MRCSILCQQRWLKCNLTLFTIKTVLRMYTKLHFPLEIKIKASDVHVKTVIRRNLKRILRSKKQINIK